MQRFERVWEIRETGLWRRENRVLWRLIRSYRQMPGNCSGKFKKYAVDDFFCYGKNLIQKGTKQYPKWMVNDGDHTC